MKISIPILIVFCCQIVWSQTAAISSTTSSQDVTVKETAPKETQVRETQVKEAKAKEKELVKEIAKETIKVSQFDDYKALDYPELQVVPKASERLILESQKTNDKGLFLMMPYVIPSLFTLTSGLVAPSSLKDSLTAEDRDTVNTNANIAVGVGAFSLALSYWYVSADHYGETVSQMRSLKSKDRRTELLKERLSEEAFERSYQQFSKAKWVFAVTHLLANASFGGKLKGDNSMIPILGILTSVVPLFVSPDFETNYHRQLDYKKRIYIPLTLMDIKYNPQTQAWIPQTSLVWQF